MANEKSEKKEAKTTTRREFLKITGAGVAGAAVTFTLMKLFDKPANTTEVFETASGAIIHDSRLCTGCRRCETTCTMVNDGKAHPYIARVKMYRNFKYGPEGVSYMWAYRDGQLGNFKLVGETCKQCADPYCGRACPVGAISAHEDTGARVVDMDACIGCGACERACPWGMATVDPERNKSTKCLLCNGHPACVQNCPNGALQFITWDDAVKVYKERGFTGAIGTNA